MEISIQIILFVISGIAIAMIIHSPRKFFMQVSKTETEIKFTETNFISSIIGEKENQTEELPKRFMNDENNTLNPVNNEKRKDIAKILKEEGLTFFESNGRMNWGMVGKIMSGDKLQVVLFGSNFYVHNEMFPCNKIMLPLIADIQKEFADTTRDERGIVCVDEKGIGA